MPGVGGSITCTTGKKSCETAQSNITTILEDTLDQWGIGQNPGYEFKAVAPSGDIIVHHIKGNFEESMFGGQTPFPIPLYPLNEELMVYLCPGGC